MNAPNKFNSAARVDTDGVLPTPYKNEDVVPPTADANGHLFVDATGSTVTSTSNLKASSDGATGLTVAANGAQQELAGDERGRAWTRLYNPFGPAPGPVGPGNGIYIQGTLNQNSAATSEFPVLVAGNAQNPLTGAGAVGAFGRVQYVVTDANGRTVVRAAGWQAHSEGYDTENRPIILGGPSLVYYTQNDTVGSSNRVSYVAVSERAQLLVTSAPWANPNPDGAYRKSCSADTGGLVQAWVVKDSPGRLRRLTVVNNDTGAEPRAFVLAINMASLPGGGEIPQYSCGWVGVMNTNNGSSITIDFNEDDQFFEAGIAIAISKDSNVNNPISNQFTISAIYV